MNEDDFKRIKARGGLRYIDEILSDEEKKAYWRWKKQLDHLKRYGNLTARAATLAKMSERYAGDPVYRERIRNKVKDRYKNDPEYRARKRAKTQEPKYLTARLRRNLKRQYDMTIDEREAMFVAQGERCRICKTDTPTKHPGWCIDHIKNTKIVRGILCSKCNTMIGMSQEDPVVLRAGADYVEEWAKIAKERNEK